MPRGRPSFARNKKTTPLSNDKDVVGFTWYHLTSPPARARRPQPVLRHRRLRHRAFILR